MKFGPSEVMEFSPPYDFDAIEDFVEHAAHLVQISAVCTLGSIVGLAMTGVMAAKLRSEKARRAKILHDTERRINKLLSAPPESYRLAAAVSGTRANITSLGDDLTRTRDEMAYLRSLLYTKPLAAQT